MARLANYMGAVLAAAVAAKTARAQAEPGCVLSSSFGMEQQGNLVYTTNGPDLTDMWIGTSFGLITITGPITATFTKFDVMGPFDGTCQSPLGLVGVKYSVDQQTYCGTTPPEDGKIVVADGETETLMVMMFDELNEYTGFTLSCEMGGMTGDPYVQLPGVAEPVFIDMPTDGTLVDLFAHDAGLRVSGTAFAVAGDESGMSWMGSVRFQTNSSTPFALVPVDPQGAGANLAAGEAPVLRSVALRVNDCKENAPIVADEAMMLPGGFNVTCSEVAVDKATCTVLSADGDEVIVTAQPAPSKFATDADAHKHMHLDLRVVQIAPGAERTEGLFSDQHSEMIKAALARRRRRH